MSFAAARSHNLEPQRRMRNVTTARMLFLNLPVRDLDASKGFFAELGFRFDPKFTDEKAACMIFDESAAFVMLLREPFFDTFINRQRCDTATHCEGLFAFSCTSRGEVDELVDRAIAAGGTEERGPQDYGFMYQRTFVDLDGHQWEALWMDEEAASRES